MFNLRKKNLGKLDKKLVLILLTLLVYGLIVLFSATKSLGSKTIFAQVVATILGLIAIIFILLIDTDFLKQNYKVIYIASIALLVLVLIIGTGREQWGSNSWIVLGPIRFQPAEIVKIGFIISFSRIIEINIKTINHPKTLLKVLIFALIPVILILLQPDAGTAMVFIFIIAVMLFAAGVKMKYFFMALGLGIASLPFIYLSLEDFQKKRILTFLNPEHDTSDSSYQAIQGKIAIGSGKFFGKGFLKGTQSQFNFIPEKQTDYIFPVLVEEFGFLGGGILIALYGGLLYRFVVLAKNSNQIFSKLVIMGLSAMFLFHIFENIGMTLGIMPVTGIPLPFFSYGGTFQLINLISVGIILSVSIQKEALSFE
ncbi:rod shape-determining protein RodA [Miniphocaeibacter halophilus]|uniref:Rod shape-determining protein RodA n=1 Tax=Miniphocaeibacter halophilus TaxID=2931922 RepID=A0AC61MU42_9FIRM|nr:rod shape-determining protein RodA [Miniphocaeibacter halophilus]QQK07661.1 rod shape-determining protein RodA [Miniphocaeibacter halophilus]